MTKHIAEILKNMDNDHLTRIERLRVAETLIEVAREILTKEAEVTLGITKGGDWPPPLRN